MTLGEGNSVVIGMDSGFSVGAGDALREVLLDAKVENRITCGVYQVATMLGMHPDRVLFCIHVDHYMGDAAMGMHFTLMEAFCRENGIKLIKVSDHKKLYSILKDVEMRTFEEEESEDDLDEEEYDVIPPCGPVTSEDLVCLLVEKPKEKNVHVDYLLDHHKRLSQSTPFPHIDLTT